MNELANYLAYADTISSERIVKIDGEVQRLQKLHPEFLGLGLFGSTARGTARIDSDIDLVVFIHAQGLPFGSLDTYEDYYRYNDEIKHYFDVELRRGVKKRYNSCIVKELQQVCNFPRDQIFDTWFVPISNTLIDFFVEYKKINGGDYVPDFILAMFFPHLGDGIEPFRSYLVQRLLELGEKGEELWAEITSDAFSYVKGRSPFYPQSSEEFVRALPSVFPSSLKEAWDKYGLMQ